MADIIAFPDKTDAPAIGRYRSVETVGTNAGISVRILSRVAKPHDLLVVLHGTADGCTTIAALPADEWAVADVIAHSTLATLAAAGETWHGARRTPAKDVHAPRRAGFDAPAMATGDRLG